jgi:indole-3-glycerol phosphate synthase
MSRLAEIIAHKQHEIQPWVGHTAEWRERANQLPPFRGFEKALTNDGFGFVAEIKKASPSAGVISEEFDPVAIAEVYEKASVQCISVLTDEKFFHGHLDYLALIRTKVTRPLLRKDFVVHESQIYQAALAGADAILLIVSALNDSDLKQFHQAASQIGIDCLVEVHDEKELDRALAIGATFLGINNRNLATFEVDLKTTEQLAPKIPDHCTVISESGIRNKEDLIRIAKAGVDAALIGEALMRAEDPAVVLKEYIEITRN